MRRIAIPFIIVCAAVCSCFRGTTYYDSNNDRQHGIGNQVYADSNLSVISTFKIYSDKANQVAGINLELGIKRDSAVQIDSIDVEIKPWINASPINPNLFESADPIASQASKGSHFYDVKGFVNSRPNGDIAMTFPIANVSDVDSLYTSYKITYNIGNVFKEIDTTRIYLKGHYNTQLSR